MTVHLLFLNHNYRNQGTYYRAMPMAERLAQRGHEVTLLTVSPDHRWRAAWHEVNGVQLGEMPGLGQDNSGNGYGPLDNGWRLLHAGRHHYDVVHMFDHKPNATFAGFPARWRGARLVADWADWWGGPGGVNDIARRRIPAIGRFETWWEERSKRWADGVVTISTVLQRRAVDLGCRPERVLYLPTGAAVDRIRPLPAGEARQRLGLPPGRQIVGFIGIGQGEMEIIMSALVSLSGVWLMVIGPQTPRVLETARSFGVADRLWQTGFVPDDQVGLHLACADVMALPMSDTAGNRGRLPNKLLDYMAAGRPTVAGPIGDVKEIVQRYGIGRLAEADRFGEVLGQLLSDPALRRTMSVRARQVAETEFGWPHLVDRLEQFYSRLLHWPAEGERNKR
jgi:glycosyltransferase involved in cell wall biosynthesis